MVEPQGQVRQEQALMLKGEDPALCHPGCVHQPVSFLETPFSHFTYWHHPPPCGMDCPSLGWGRGQGLH